MEIIGHDTGYLMLDMFCVFYMKFAKFILSSIQYPASTPRMISKVFNLIVLFKPDKKFIETIFFFALHIKKIIFISLNPVPYK